MTKFEPLEAGFTRLRATQGRPYAPAPAAMMTPAWMRMSGRWLARSMALSALWIKFDSHGPIFFRQKHFGFNNEVITVVTFRTMRIEVCDAFAHRQVSSDDPRVTRYNRFLRRTSLDELQQLINVLRGDISLVGPRPHAVALHASGQETARMTKQCAWRHRVKPGITGWAKINGSRRPVETEAAVRRRVELDLAYIRRQFLALDLDILVMTVQRLLGDRQAIR